MEMIVAGYEIPTERLTTATDDRNPSASGAAHEMFSAGDRETAPSSGRDGVRHLTAFAIGLILVMAGVAGFHHLYRGGDSAGDWIVWVAALLAWLTALGGGVKLATWGIKPVIDAVSEAAQERFSEAVQSTVAALGIVFGAVGLWWVLRGGYAQWWQSISGEPGWSLTVGVGQMLVAVLAGATLFTGGKYLAGLTGQVLADAGLVRTENTAAHRNPTDDGAGAESHPMLVAALAAGGLALVAMTVWLTPKLAPTVIGTNAVAAAGAIAALLLWGVGANLGWWKGLEGLYAWATAASEKTAAVAGIVAVLMFSAGGLGLGWFTPATVPQAHAQCPPDCGGGSNGSNSYGPDASQFQPPQMPNQMPDYQGGNYGSNQAPLDQNSGISIYNTQAPSVSQGTSGQSAQQSLQGSQTPQHGSQIPDYQSATPYTQGPGAPNPDYNGGQANQGAPQQQTPQQPPAIQDQGQQPPQQSDQQKIDDLTKQLQQQKGQQKQNGNQKLPKAPSKDKKKDDQQDRDKQSGDNDLTALLLGAASTRRRKQGEQDQPEQGQQQAQGPDTQALPQDGAQMGQSLPSDVTNTVSDSVNLGQSAGSAAQNFGSAAQAGASIASSAQSGAVNPMDAVALVQGISGGISNTADAVNSGTSIASTWLNEAGQGAQLAADANPQLKPQAQQVEQLTMTAGQVSDLTGQVAGGVSQASGLVNTASSLGASGMPDTSGASDLLSDGGTAQALSGGSGLGGHLAQAPMEPPSPTPTPPNYPEVPRTITPTPSASPAPSPNPEIPRTITLTPPSTSPSTPPPAPSTSSTPEPHLVPPVTAPGPTPEPPPTTSSTPPPTPTTNPPTPSSTTETSPPASSTTPPPPAAGQWDPIDLKDVTYVKDPNVATGQEAARGYINQALDKMGITDPAARENWMNGYLTMSYRESTWNPNAINTYDSNAQASTYTVADGEGNNDSRGLVQAIPTTFAGYHQSGTSNNIYDPVASVAASMNYVMHFPAYGVSRDGSDLAQIIQQANPNKGPKGY
ncbi:hypothetical protein EJ571_25895 [Mycobacteroides franklinii]|uniref:Transglycosylase SLT domain-containing protein n=2 Tax=Mycobacteroides franklinii TaxID=948102 RepID=A0A4R5P468_9MYCO|nr:hypothetical protein BST24_26805 [Mycobacteroides franklinii]TDH17735.1 hypothetical protein EJ571_25895 [Mycobacteroides franklinii]